VPVQRHGRGAEFGGDPAHRQRGKTFDVRHRDGLVEIGPGRGALTERLLARTEVLDAVEIDRDLSGLLRERFPQRLTLHQADALKFDFAALAAAHLGTAAFVAAVPQIARAQAAAFDNISNFSEFVTVFWQYASHIVFTLAVLTIITGGVVYVASAGAEERIDSAKEIIRGAVISIILVVISGSAIDMLIEKPQRGVACHQVPETVNGAQVMKEVCTSPDDAFKVINNVSSMVIALAASFTVVMIMLNAIRYVTAAGDEDKIASARRGITYSVIGLAICAAAYVIVRNVIGIFGA